MGDHDVFERIAASLYEAALDDARWPATSALIDEACGIHGNALVIGDGPKEQVQARFIGLYYRGQRAEELEREYLEDYHRTDERVPRLRQLPDSRVVHVTSLYTEQELRTSRTYNELTLRARGQDGLNVRMDLAESSHIAWGLSDPVTSGGWGSSELALVDALLPHVRQFVRVRRALAGAGVLATSVTGLLDKARIGVIHLDRLGRIAAANDRARAILRRGEGVSDQDGVLQANLPADRARLERLLAAAVPVARGGVGGSMLLGRGGTVAPLVVHVQPVAASRPYGLVTALLLLVEPARRGHIDPVVVARTLGLTPAESRVAVRLAEGQTVRDIAAATGRKEGSIRWHLKRIYDKRGLSGQVDLVRLVLSVTEFA